MYEITYSCNGDWRKSYAYVSAVSAEDARRALRANEPGLYEIYVTALPLT